jgi:hypothetical protein
MNSTTICRNATAPCDATEFCTGGSPTCPDDKKSDTSFVCRPPIAPCDAPEFCDGISLTCPPDLKSNSSVVCRGLNGSCDTPEYCTGYSLDCPPDLYANKTTICRPALSICDVPDYCVGNSSECPMDRVSQAKDVLCRNASGVCDIPEYCDGTLPSCPVDLFRNSSNLCLPAMGQCGLPQYCEGASATCPDRVFGECIGGICDTQNGICYCANNRTGFPICEEFCGDNMCNQKGAETCVNCPSDCKAPCGLCGDGACSLQENCDSCYEDCEGQVCSTRDCTLNCPGQCTVEGRCICLGGYFGPNCLYKPLPVQMVTPGPYPSIVATVIVPSTKQRKQFTLALIGIAEEDSSGLTRSVDLSSTKFEVDYVYGSTYQKWTFRANISTFGILNVYFTYFTSPNQKRSIMASQTANTLQMQVDLASWAFRSARNSLKLISENSIVSEPIDQCSIEPSLAGGSVEWFQLHAGGVALYYEMSQRAQLDGKTRFVANDMKGSDSNTETRIPFFWYNMSLTTTFGFLPDNFTCQQPHKSDKGGNDWAIFLLIPLIILFLVIICLVIMFIIKPSRVTRCFKKCLRRRRIVNTDTKHPMMASVGSEMVILPPSSPPSTSPPLSSPPPSEVPPPSWHGSTSNLPPMDPSYPPPSGHMSMQYSPPPNHTYRPHQSSPYPQHQQYHQEHNHQQQYNAHEPAPSAPLPTPDNKHYMNSDQ